MTKAKSEILKRRLYFTLCRLGIRNTSLLPIGSDMYIDDCGFVVVRDHSGTRPFGQLSWSGESIIGAEKRKQ